MRSVRAAMMLFAVIFALSLSGCGDHDKDGIDTGNTQDSYVTSVSDAMEDVTSGSSASAAEKTEEEDTDNIDMDANMMSYTIKRVGGEINWNEIPMLSADNILWQPDCGVRAYARLCHDGQRLYVLLSAEEKDIRAENTAPLSPVYEDSCLEFFFMPDNEDRYLNFEINPNGCLTIGFGHNRKDRVDVYREDMREYFDISAWRTDAGWEVSYSIPIEFLNVFYKDYTFSGNLRANFYKCGDRTANRHYLAWNYVTLEKPDFHRPQDFGLMIFE